MSKGGIFSRIKGAAGDGGSKKMLIFSGVLIVGAVAYAMWPAPEVRSNPGSFGSGPVGTPSAQGSAPVTEVYKKELDQDDRARVEEAKAKGGSAIPTVVIGNQAAQTPLIIKEDELEPREPPQVSPPSAPVIEQKPVIMAPAVPATPIVTPAGPQVPVGPSVENLAKYMGDITRKTYAVAEVQYMYTAPPAASNPQSAPSAPAAGAAARASRVPLPMAGDVLYAQIEGRANSDAPGPVTAKILQGPLAGATLIGTFSTGRDALVISFDKLAVKKVDGEDVNEVVDIKAVAVDTKYRGTALATEVDRHLLQKIGIGLAASFAEGFGRAVSQRNSTSTYRSDGSYTTSTSDLSAKDELMSAGGHAIASTGNILMDEFGRRPTTIIVDAETPIGVLFL